ncbi:hypothetical protein ABBQ38_006409 [Trebouxia sp. C0009 RCD-2024]
MLDVDLPVVLKLAQRSAELPTVEDWPDRPVLMQSALSSQPARTERINTSVPMCCESDMFEGHSKFWAAGLSSTPDHRFQGQKRKTWLVVQGRFKQPLPFDSVLSGQCFSGPLQHMPASWLTSMIFKLVHQINPSIFVGSVDAPSLLAPIVSMAQCVSVAVPGTEPSLDASPIEDMRLLGAAFQMPSGQYKGRAESVELGTLA